MLPYRVLHVALEGGPASFGGLGKVATQMMEAQNHFMLAEQPQFTASIITPLYPTLYQSYTNKIQVAEIEHLYNHTLVNSKIYLSQQGNNKHYLLEPPDEYKHLFNINSLPDIYNDTATSFFIERVKFFNSAVAAYIGKGIIGINHPDPQILQQHDWQAALVAPLLSDLYKNTSIKTVFMVHIDNSDSGAYPDYCLQGIGLAWPQEVCLLKAIGLINADKIVVVSPRLLKECIESPSDQAETEFLRKIFVWASQRQKTAGITNGINYKHYCPVGKLIKNPANIYAEKTKIKQQLTSMLSGSRAKWRLNPDLPLILYIGRFSPEKGVDTFAQVIKAINGRAIFIAIGRSMTDDVYNLVLNQSRQTANVLVSFSEQEQAKFIDRMRAAADFVYIPSRREACGLVAPEGLANGAVCITTGVGGLRDLITELNYTDKNNTTGNGIFFEVMPEGQDNPALSQAIDQALSLWQELNAEQKNALQLRIMQDAEKFDWQAPDGSLQKYLAVFAELLEPELELQQPERPAPKP